MDQNDIIDLLSDSLHHANEQTRDLLKMLDRKDSEIKELEKKIKILEASAWPEDIREENVNMEVK